MSEERGQSKILDPSPRRKRYVIDLLYRFFNREISYAELTGLSQRELLQIAEAGHIKITYGRIEDAKKIFECLVKLDPNNFYHHASLGIVYQKQRQYVDAVFEYTEALQCNPSDISSLVNRGEIYLIHKNYRKAAEDFREAIVKDPQGKNPYANRARSLVIAIKRSLQTSKDAAAAAPAAVPAVKAPGLPQRPRLPGK